LKQNITKQQQNNNKNTTKMVSYSNPIFAL